MYPNRSSDGPIGTLSPVEIERAHDWWMKLDSQYKAASSIWILLALYEHDLHPAPPAAGEPGAEP